MLVGKFDFTNSQFDELSCYLVYTATGRT